MMMFNNVQNPPFKMMLDKMFISDQLCFQQLLSPLSPLFFGTLPVNLGKQDKRSGVGLIEKKKKTKDGENNTFKLQWKGAVKNTPSQPGQTR